MAVYRGLVLTIPDGLPVPDGTTVEFRRESDDSLITSVTTSGGEFVHETNGTLPPHRIVAVHGSQTHIQSSKTTGMTGAVTLSVVPYLMRAWSDGVIDGLLDELAVSATGTTMNLTVATGVAHVHGVVYDRLTSGTLGVPTADSVNPRIDTVVVEAVPVGAGADIEGESSVRIVSGTPAASPVAPALTQSGTLWQIPLADIRVNAGVTAITSANVTDRRTFATPTIPEEAIQDLVGAMVESENASVYIDYQDDDGDLDLRVHQGWLMEFINSRLAMGAGMSKTYSGTVDAGGTITLTAGDGSGAAITTGFDDTNFADTGTISSGTRTLGTASITLGPGTYRINSMIQVSARNASGGEGYVRFLLAGNGAPSGANQSSRPFRTGPGTDSRMVILTGRKVVTPSAETTYQAIAQVRHESGAASYIEQGVVTMWADQ